MSELSDIFDDHAEAIKAANTNPDFDTAHALKAEDDATASAVAATRKLIKKSYADAEEENIFDVSGVFLGKVDKL